MDSTYFSQTRIEIASLLPRDVATAMELGCGEGSTLAWLKTVHGIKRTIGIEIDATAAAKAVAHVDEVHVVDISANQELLEPYRASVNLLLLLDVLEHLRNPLHTLRQVKSVLASDGVVVASVPNIRSIKVLIPLILKGEFKYADSGILDRTHLVFFTKKSIIQLFTDAGFHCQTVRGNGALSFSEAKTSAGKLVALFNVVTLGMFEGFLANQWLVSARQA